MKGDKRLNNTALQDLLIRGIPSQVLASNTIWKSSPFMTMSSKTSGSSFLVTKNSKRQLFKSGLKVYTEYSLKTMSDNSPMKKGLKKFASDLS